MLWFKLIKAVLKRDDQIYHQRSAYTDKPKMLIRVKALLRNRLRQAVSK